MLFLFFIFFYFFVLFLLFHGCNDAQCCFVSFFSGFSLKLKFCLEIHFYFRKLFRKLTFQMFLKSQPDLAISLCYGYFKINIQFITLSKQRYVSTLL